MLRAEQLFILHHVFLPPKLPQSSDDDKEAGILLPRLLTAAREFSGKVKMEYRHAWKKITMNIRTWIQIYSDGVPCESDIEDAIRSMQDGDTLLLYVRCQNAAILLRQTSTSTIFEAFEVQPKTEAVLAAQDALLRSFPAKSVSIPSEKMQDSAFVHQLALHIYKLSTEHVTQSMEKSLKGNEEVVEERQSEHPMLVTDWLLTTLATVGGPSDSSLIIHKRTHDEICFKDALRPWRRSAIWLSVRVALQITAQHFFLDDGDHQYKNFMLFLINRLATEIVTTRDAGFDELHIIRAKIARRHVKLDLNACKFVGDLALDCVNRITNQMDQMWQDVTDLERINIPQIRIINPTQSFILDKSFIVLKEFWDESRLPTENLPSASSLVKAERSVHIHLSIPEFSSTYSSDCDGIFSLLAMEDWVANSLQTWMNLARAVDHDCKKIVNLMTSYYDTARVLYDGLPERLSIMLLTIMELWVALDQLAIRFECLVRDYSSEMPVNFFSPLLLSKRGQMKRLVKVESYLARRESMLKTPGSPIFGTIDEKSFAVRYFDSSSELQELKANIETQAHVSRAIHQARFEALHKKQQRLLKEVLFSSCDEFTFPPWDDRAGELGHKRDCRKCEKRNAASRIKIGKHEWPLPADIIMAKAAVFELKPPMVFVWWREAMLLIRNDILLGSTKQSHNIRGFLHCVDALSDHLEVIDRRVVLASSVKPMNQTHYDVQELDHESIFVDHCMRYKYYDKKAKAWLREQTDDRSFSRHCRTKTTSTTPLVLRKAINQTTQGQNTIIAEQDKCPLEFSMPEFVSICSLRSGGTLQWANLLASLCTGQVNFNNTIVGMIVEQLAYQIGPCSDDQADKVVRDYHVDLHNPSFVTALTTAIDSKLDAIESNWQETETAATLLIIILRLLSFSNSLTQKIRTMRLIRKVRLIALQWLRRMGETSDQIQDVKSLESSYTSVDQRMLNAALVVRATWDVELPHLAELFEGPDDIGDFIECSVHIHDLSSRFAKTRGLVTARRLRLDRILAAKLEKVLTSMAESHDENISRGIHRFVPSLDFDKCWQAVITKDGYWLVNTTGENQTQVQINLFSGKLTIDGKPLRHLPEVYLGDTTYKTIFGDRVINVVTSDVPEMDYRATTYFSGHTVFLALRDAEVLIRSKINGRHYQVVPKRVFRDDLPPLLIKDTIAWMDLANGCIVFRRKVWEHNPEDLTLRFDRISPWNSSLRQGSNAYISHTSHTGRLMSQAFMHFEKSVYLHMSYDINTGHAEVRLPRYQLSFKVDKQGSLYCSELSSVVSQSQAIGTLHGLRTRLLLESVGSMSNYSKKTVIIPYGIVSIKEEAPHVNVCIENENTTTVKYFRYQVDEQLGQLGSNNDLEAHFFKTYLHAITSSPLVDSLTLRTGTAESLQGLSDRFTKTTIPLASQAQTILGMIARLTPSKSFYPAHLKSMQQTYWHGNLPSLSQHGLFFVTVENILKYNRQSLAFFDGSEVFLPEYVGDIALLHRCLSRSTKYYVAEAVVAVQRKTEDQPYDSRDRRTGANSQQAYQIASLIGVWPHRMPVQVMFNEISALSHCVSGFQKPFFAAKLMELLNVNIKASWPSLLKLCLEASNKEQEQLRFEFSLMAFGNSTLRPYLTTLLAFATCWQLKSLAAPLKDSYDLSLGRSLDWKVISGILEDCKLGFEPLHLQEKKFSFNQMKKMNMGARRQYESQVEREREQIAAAVKSCWPTEDFTLPTATSPQRYDCSRIKESLEPHLRTWSMNHHFHECIGQYDLVLQTIEGEVDLSRAPELNLQWSYEPQRAVGFDRPSLLLLMQRNPKLHPSVVVLTDELKHHGVDSMLDSLQLHRTSITVAEQYVRKECEDKVGQIVETLCQDEDGEHQAYSSSLSQSLAAVRARKYELIGGRFSVPSRSQLDVLHFQAKHKIGTVLKSIRNLLKPSTDSLQGLQKAGLWPEVTHLALLRLLCLGCRHHLPDLWKDLLVGFAQAMSAIQRIERIKKYIDVGDDFALYKELDNQAHSAWTVADHPDWLLLEVQNDMLIRPIQIKVACEIMKDENASLMLGMGEGKTSVILPMVVTEMANGNKLLRVIVLKSLANEMLRTLSHSLAGLVDRAVYYLPFSRHTIVTPEAVRTLCTLYKDCKSSQGVLLTLPEHLNSFRLAGNDHLSSPNNRVLAKQLLSIQKWLDLNSRDVMDECDEILKPAYELVYTNGEAKLLRGAPDRWCLVLNLLSLLKLHVPLLQKDMPESIEIEERNSDSYPKIRILKVEGFNFLAHKLLDDIVQGRLSGVPPCHLVHSTKDALREFVLKSKPSPSAVQTILGHFQDVTILEKLYLLRGLMASGILLSALSRRWHVNYGLDRSRCLSAVPYRAKSTPSPAAEFAQPEMMVLLTTLSFYYTGLTLEDTQACLIRLHKIPDPADEYTEWVNGSSIPSDLRSLASVNIEDATCIARLHNHLSFNTSLINFFLNHIVFPKEAKEFPKRLASSAWDLCSDHSTKTTTGFSGTGDSLLPLSMPQRNVPDLEHTAASILCTLVRPENQKYVCFSNAEGRRLNSAELLGTIAWQDETPSVIIDVGAQFLEANHDVALQLLHGRPEKQAVVFFDEKDRKMVADRSGRFETWDSSPFRDQTNVCLFYLDEFHTRGTDFHFPDDYCGAVLLGPGLQKDTCVQACMRMRKLGFTQSIVFFAPPEIDNSIRTVVGAAVDDALTSYDVLLWTIYNSCTASRNQRALWLLRGLAHAQRKHAFSEHVKNSGAVTKISQYLGKLQEIESRPLSDMYGVSQDRNVLPYQFNTTDRCDSITSSLLGQFRGIDAEALLDHDREQEQEREILHEVEQEREVQRPQAVTPCKATIDLNLLAAIRGDSDAASVIRTPSCFQVLEETSLKNELSFKNLPDCVRATRGFLNTIIQSNKAVIDDFLRPVQWVLQIKGKSDIYLISPYEANIFMPALRTSRTAVLSLYSARTSKAMKSFDMLDIYRVPEKRFEDDISNRVLTVLRLFAGQLYFNTLDEYKSFCQLLGLWDASRVLQADGRSIEADLFVPPKCRALNGWDCKFSKSPVICMRKWINMRRHGIEWTHTHVGRVLNGQVLTERDFE